MARFRFSILSLMAAVLLSALGFAAIRSESEVWASATFTAAVLVASVLSLGACTPRISGRMVWAAAAGFCWLYLVLAFAPWFRSEIRPHLITTVALNRLYPLVSGSTVVPIVKNPAIFHAYNMAGSYEVISGESLFARQGVSAYFDFQCIGHSLSAIFWAILGAVAGAILESRAGSRQRPADRENHA